MHTISSQVKRHRWWVAGMVYVLTVSILGPVAEASFHLENADGSRPVDGLSNGISIDGMVTMDGMVTAPRQPSGAPVAAFLPKPRLVQPAAPQTVPGGTSVWDCIARYESGNRPLGCAPHCGRLQWLPSTWRMAGGTRYASLPQNATWEQEKAVATSWLAKTSWASQWPSTSRRCGLR